MYNNEEQIFEDIDLYAFKHNFRLVICWSNYIFILDLDLDVDDYLSNWGRRKVILNLRATRIAMETTYV